MIRAQHHFLYERFFDTYLWWKMRMNFHAHRIVFPFQDTHTNDALPFQGALVGSSKSVLIIGNHFSWWDGFIARAVNHRVVKRKLHLMMLEKQLRTRMFLSRIGAFSIRPNHRSALESVNYAIELLHDPGNLVILFPQGRFQSISRFPLGFQPGWFRILRNAPENTAVIFMANLVDYFDRSKPTLTTYLYQTDQQFETATETEEAYNLFLKEAIDHQDRHIPH